MESNTDTAKMEMDEPAISSSVEALPVATASPSVSSVLVNGASSSTAEPESEPVTKEEALKAALNHLGQGKRFLLVKDVSSAIVSLGESCQILVELNGQLCPDNAEAHFYYGKALLEQSRLDLAVFNDGPAQPGDKADSSEENDDEDNSDEEENENDSKESEDNDNEAEAEAMDSSEVMNGTIEGPAIGEHKKDEDLNAPSPSRVEDNEKPSTSSGVNAEKEAEEEPTNLELAWEVLEVAKIAYTAQLSDFCMELQKDGLTEEEKDKVTKSKTTITKRLADTHSLLGEVATESENYEQAVEDFKIAIQIISELEGFDNRDVAQFYFQMGLAFAFWKNFEQAISSFKKSKEIIELRIKNLTEKINNKQTFKDLGLEYDDPSVTEEVEVAELKAVIPELEEKIADTIDAERDNKATLEEEVQEKEILEKSSPVKNPNPPAVNDISHLVKKKKKAEDLPAETPAAKRPCNESRSTDNNVEVSSSSNGTSENNSATGTGGTVVVGQ